MNNYVISVGIVYLVIVTFIMAKIMMEKKDTLTIPRKKKNKEKKSKPEHFNDYDIKAEYVDVIGDGIDGENNKQSDDDKMFVRAIRPKAPSNKIAGSGKNLQYQMLKDGFQIVDNGSVKTGHIDSMCGIAMSDYGA